MRHRAHAHPVRLHVLRLLAAEGPLGVRELAQRVGLRPNGVRRHLDLLVRAGLVAAHAGRSAGPGRPRLLYARAAGEERVGYPLLADMLAGTLARVAEAEAAEEEGRSWGRRLVERAPAADAGRALTTMLDRLGFAPQTADGGLRVDIHRCPFDDTARSYPGVVCSLHLGLMRGALAELGAPLEAERLDPFVEPSLCVAHLRRTA